ncbi:hypothetical protein CEXT_80881 [Caerostris extrusa]|uniref:Uncharacterized protein n=1 Tax=Caerostris extrusa TaxID=172846 RepID=A0AAV4M636_CAEEX|nr:hypothetical protein CEXT_80881 [Caerostris extrusa]
MISGQDMVRGGGTARVGGGLSEGQREVANTLFIPFPRSNQPAPLSPCKEIDKEAAASVVALTFRPPPPLSPSRNHGNDTPDAKLCRHSGLLTNGSQLVPPRPRDFSIPPSRPNEGKDEKKRKGIKEKKDNREKK